MRCQRLRTDGAERPRARAMMPQLFPCFIWSSTRALVSLLVQVACSGLRFSLSRLRAVNELAHSVSAKLMNVSTSPCCSSPLKICSSSSSPRSLSKELGRHLFLCAMAWIVGTMAVLVVLAAAVAETISVSAARSDCRGRSSALLHYSPPHRRNRFAPRRRNLPRRKKLPLRNSRFLWGVLRALHERSK